MKPFGRKWIIIIVILLAVLLLGRKIFRRPFEANGKIDRSNQTIAEVQKGNLQKSLVFAGKVDAQNYAILRFQSSGELSWVGVKEGDLIKKWQIVASLNKESLKKSFQKEANDYLTARWNFEDTQDEYKDLKEKYLITPEVQRILDRQQFNLNNSVLDYEIADLAVKYASLISPIEGIVTNIDYPTSGVNITPANFSLTIIDPKSIYFKSEVDEEDVVNIFAGKEATIILDSYPEENTSSRLESISFVPVEGLTTTRKEKETGGAKRTRIKMHELPF